MPNYKCTVCAADYSAKLKKCETPKCKGTVKLVPDKVEKLEQTMSAVGGNYHLLGSAGSLVVYGRLNRAELQKLKNAEGLDFDTYESAMKKGIIPSTGTAKDGVKKEPYGWVIKTTISQAQATGGNNVVSPLATATFDGSKAFLDFNQLVRRH